MSKVFYDKHIDLSGIEKEVKKAIDDPAAREEIFVLIDEIVHHRMVGCILDRLPKAHHKEFIDHLVDKPHDEGILSYLGERISEDVGEFLREEVNRLSGDLLSIVKAKTEKES